MRPTPRRSSVSSKIRPSAAVSRAPARTLSQIGVSRPSENRTGCVLLASGPGPPSARPVCMLKVRQDECQDFARWYPDFCFRTIRKEKRSMHTRRSFLKGAVAATAAVAAGPTILVRDARAAGQLKILQWSHFVPAYDKWFDPWAKEWGSKHGVDVTVDHVGFADVVPRATAEVAAQSGHDIHMFLGLASAFEEHVIDLADVVTSLEKKYGKPVELARRSTYNPFTKKQFALSDMWVPDPGNYHKEVWTKIGMPNGPVTYDDLVKAAPEIKKVAPQMQIPIGVGLSQDIDSNMAVRNILWCPGGSIQDQDVAKEFLVALVDASRDSMLGSKLYNFPSFYGAAADPGTPLARKQESGAAWITAQCNKDPFGSAPADKLALLAKSLPWSTNLGYPGYANPAEGEMFDTYVITDMFAKAATGAMAPKDAMLEANTRARQMFDKWRAEKVVGGGGKDK